MGKNRIDEAYKTIQCCSLSGTKLYVEYFYKSYFENRKLFKTDLKRSFFKKATGFAI